MISILEPGPPVCRFHPEPLEGETRIPRLFSSFVEALARVAALSLSLAFVVGCAKEGHGATEVVAPALAQSQPAPADAVAVREPTVQPAGMTVPAGATVPANAPVAASIASGPLDTFLTQEKFAEGLAWLGTQGKGTAEERRYRGLFHHGLAQPDPTLEHLVPVYRAKPTDDTVALAVAEASLWKKDYKTALAIVTQLQAPDAPDALRVRGMVFEHAGRYDEALALYERAIPLLKQPWGTLERKAQVLSWKKKFDAALATYAQVTDSKAASLPLRRRCRVRMAEITAWKKDLDGALAQLATLLGEDANFTDALLLRGQILEWKGEYSLAKQSYSHILRVDAGHVEARSRLDKLLWAP